MVISWVLVLPALADTIVLKSGEEVKGLVVEEHEDRIILSTADGEIPIMRKDLGDIQFDETAYSLLSIGRALERQGKYGDALSYYEKALSLNQDLKEAKRAANGVRNRFFAQLDAAPLNEIDKQQDLENAWRTGSTVADQAQKFQEDQENLIWQRLGIKLIQEEDWIKTVAVRLGSNAFKQGIRKGDSLVQIDGKSLRYLNAATVMSDLLKPRYSSMTVRVQRDMKFPSGMKERQLKSLGFDLKQEYDGLVISKVYENSLAKQKRFKEGDQIIKVNDQQTRYLSKRKVINLIQDKKSPELSITINREFKLPRK